MIVWLNECLKLRGAERWSEVNLDIYAAGMIGIQVLTGIEPKNLPIDRLSNEIIWRFSTANNPGVQISSELAKILDKMICYRSEDRYLDVSQVLQQLRELRGFATLAKPKPLRVPVNRRLLMGCIAGLFATNIASYLWYRTVKRLRAVSNRFNRPRREIIRLM